MGHGLIFHFILQFYSLHKQILGNSLFIDPSLGTIQRNQRMGNNFLFIKTITLFSLHMYDKIVLNLISLRKVTLSYLALSIF